MADRPDSHDLAQYSYILAFTSAGLLLLVFLVGLIPIDALGVLSNLVWLVLITELINNWLPYVS